MTENSERISLASFHRHLLVTHLKGNSAAVIDQLKMWAEEHRADFGKMLLEMIRSYDINSDHPEWFEDAWYAAEVPVRECYFAHADFRLLAVPKNEQIVRFLDENRTKIDSDCFPCSREIRAEWRGPMPEPLLVERGAHRYYVLDGQLRVMWHGYHGIPTVRGFIYKGNRKV